MPAKKNPEIWMRRAIQLSKRGYPAPNPHVGCVIVKRGQIVGEGWHEFAGGPHAEIVALMQAGSRAGSADVYVTLEPCNHHGKTPPCSEALILAGVAKVAFANKDPNARASGGSQRLRKAGIEVEHGLCKVEAADANRIWLTAMSLQRPFVVAKAAVSLDGRIASARGESKWITGESARKQAHKLRAELGAVLIGCNTAELDDPLLTARVPGVKNQPLRIVLDPKRRIPESANLFNSGPNVLRIVKKGRAKSHCDLEIGMTNGAFNLHELLAMLWDQGVTGLLVEGGGITIGHFFQASLVDRIDLFVAPKVLGDGPLWVQGFHKDQLIDADPSKETACRQLGEDVWIQSWLQECPRP